MKMIFWVDPVAFPFTACVEGAFVGEDVVVAPRICSSSERVAEGEAEGDVEIIILFVGVGEEDGVDLAVGDLVGVGEAVGDLVGDIVGV